MKNNKGFTLIEIIAVLVIIGILAAIAIPKFFEMQATAEKKTAELAWQDMKSRAAVAYGRSQLNNNGVATAADQSYFSNLGLTEDNVELGDDPDDIYQDFANPDGWTYGNTVITYTGNNGDATYTLTAGDDEQPAQIAFGWVAK